MAQAEASSFGFTHAHVGGLLARRWNLSPALQEAVMYHHSPGGTPDEWMRGFLLHCANTIAHECARGEPAYRGHCADADSLAMLGVASERLDEIRSEVRRASA